MFHCDHCGCCCRHLEKSAIYASLNRGDGVCKYLKGNDCSIYENRPLLCRVDESYKQLFWQFITKEEYYHLNKLACEKLKELEE